MWRGLIMKVYGADFSGARDPSRGIYYAEGFLNESTLHIESVVHCDDRLDLLAAIHFSKAPWGLDFPFSISADAMQKMNIASWDALLSMAANCQRSDFDYLLENGGIPSCELQCTNHSICCRAADAAVRSFSSLKKTNPNMRMMTYAGLKLLSYLRRLGSRVYPFDQLDLGVSRLYEVYPSHSWKQVGLSRDENLARFIGRFSEQYGFRVTVKDNQLYMPGLDAADAVVACVTLGYGIYQYNLESDWARQQAWMSETEWSNRHQEGLIVKTDSPGN